MFKESIMKSYIQSALTASLLVLSCTYFLNFFKNIKCFLNAQNNSSLKDILFNVDLKSKKYKNGMEPSCVKQKVCNESTDNNGASNRSSIADYRCKQPETSEMYDKACLDDNLNISFPEIEILRSDIDNEDEEMQIFEKDLDSSVSEIEILRSDSDVEDEETRLLEKDIDSSLPEIEILRSDSDVEDEEMRLFEKELEEKKLILKKRRQELCDKLLAYKLMEFSVSPDIVALNQTPPEPASAQPQFKTPYPVNIEERPQTPSPSPGFPPVVPLFNEHELSYSTEQEQIDLAIKLSIQDMEKVHAPIDEESWDSDLSTKIPIESIYHSPPRLPNALSQNPNDPAIVFDPQVNVLIPDLENLNQQSGSNPGDEIVEQWEGNRYVGDKGKRPMSGKYSYKKKAKTIQPPSEEPAERDNEGPTTSTSHSEKQPPESELREESRSAE